MNTESKDNKSGIQFSYSNDGQTFINIIDGQVIEFSGNHLIFRTKIGEYKKGDGSFMALQVVALASKSDFDKFRIGSNLSSSDFFSPGTGMAPNEDNLYHSLIVTNMGHHYLYHDRNGESRFSRYSKEEDGLFLVDWEIEDVDFEDASYKLTDLPGGKNIYIIAMINLNKNDEVENGEIVKFELVTGKK